MYISYTNNNNNNKKRCLNKIKSINRMYISYTNNNKKINRNKKIKK